MLMNYSKLLSPLAVVFVALAIPPRIVAAAEAPPSAADVQFFENKIRPVLTENCYKCHGAEAVKAGKLKGDLRLDSRAGVLKGGENGPVIVPGKPDDSRLIQAVRYTDDDLKMPPKVKLPAGAIADLEKWVSMGAPDPRGSSGEVAGAEPDTEARPEPVLWVLKPVIRPDVPVNGAGSVNPIDAFIAAGYKAHGLTPVGPADKRTLLRRVCLDLTGLAPTPAEQDAFLADSSPDAYEKVVDRLLASEQHGVRYARHWLDVLRYADADERMIAAPGISLWRDWMIHALNDDVPYDQFVRAQLTGYRSTVRTEISSLGYRARVEPRPDDMFALGFLARGDVIRDGKDAQELPIAAVETVSTAFMGLTVGCAKCHNHKFDPIRKLDFYAMKALFDPLVLKKVTLATSAELFARGKAMEEAKRKRAEVEASIEELVGPYRKQLYEDRIAMLPADVQAIVRKPEQQRSAAEQKVADDYYPVLRIDSDKIQEALPEAKRIQYKEILSRIEPQNAAGAANTALPAFWTVESDPKKEMDKSYVLVSGDPERPEKDHEVAPSWPFAPTAIDFRDGRIEAFSDWLTAPENPMFARVAVNRLWQWHFGVGLQKTPSDFGKMGGTPSDPRLLDWLASEFVRRGFSMKQMNRLIVTSQTYKLASSPTSQIAASDARQDPDDTYLWHFRLQRLEAEPIWDSIFSAAGTLDLAVGGPSFDIRENRDVIVGPLRQAQDRPFRRAAYIVRGYSTNRDVVPAFLQSFDVDDGRVPCPVRTQTVTAPQALFLMNSDPVERATALFAERLRKESSGDLHAAVDLAYRFTLARPPSQAEMERALAYLDNDPARLKGLAWLMFNLDEFTYVR